MGIAGDMSNILQRSGPSGPAQENLRPGSVINGSINGIDLTDITAETDLNSYYLGVRGLRPTTQATTWLAGQYMTVNGLRFFWSGADWEGRWKEGISTGLHGTAPMNKAYVRPAEAYPVDGAVTDAASMKAAGYVAQVHANFAAAAQVTVGAVVAHYVANNLADRSAGTWADGAAA